MGSREQILRAIRAKSPEPAELPELDGPWTTYEDPQAQFGAVLAAAGGRCVVVQSGDRIQEELDRTPGYAEAKKICSLVPGLGKANVDLEAIADPHELEDVDFAVVPGRFAVAENGAVWLTDRGVKHRAILFIVQHLVLVVPADQIVHNMHQAYRRLRFEEPQFGIFLSGPSKTADIEQSLVIGAHGPRSLTVFLLG